MGGDELLSAEAAWAALAPRLEPLPAVDVDRRQALGRVAAAGADATVDVPSCDVSAMDGYALGGDAGDRLAVSATIAAGDRPGHRLAAGTAARIMTGAPVPTGADRIVPIEATDGGVELVTIDRDSDRGAHIRRRGEVVRAGRPLLAPGTAITAGLLAHLATHGHATVAVHRAPRVAVLTTGDEVVAPEVEPEPGQLRDSHTDFLLAAGRELGLDFRPLGIAGDDPKALAERVADGLDGADVLLIGGGVSKGAFDWVERTLARCGCALVWHGVAIQPGKPLLTAARDRRLVFGLPGNPNSVMATYTLFVRPALRRLMGHDDGFWHGARGGVLAGPLREGGGLDRFLPARVEWRDGDAVVTPVSLAGSHDLAAFAAADALVRAAAGAPPLGVGDRCSWIPLPA